MERFLYCSADKKQECPVFGVSPKENCPKKENTVKEVGFPPFLLSRKWDSTCFFVKEMGFAPFLLSKIRDLACCFCLELGVFKLFSLKVGVSLRLYYYRTLRLSFR